MLTGVLFEAVGEKYCVSYPYGGRVENVLSICDISKNAIVLLLKSGALCVKGEGLEITSYERGDVVIKGRIERVERVK